MHGKGKVTFKSGKSRLSEWKDGERVRWLDWEAKGSRENIKMFNETDSPD